VGVVFCATAIKYNVNGKCEVKGFIDDDDTCATCSYAGIDYGNGGCSSEYTCSVPEHDCVVIVKGYSFKWQTDAFNNCIAQAKYASAAQTLAIRILISASFSSALGHLLLLQLLLLSSILLP
jgi:hypothetical protein